MTDLLKNNMDFFWIKKT